MFFDEGDVVDQAEMEREEAFQVPGVRWDDRALLPFSMARRAYFLSWRAAFGAPPLLVLFQAEADAFLEDALRMVFLCSKSPEELEGLRYDLRRMQAACDAWADECVKVEDVSAVINAALKLWNGTTITRAVSELNPDAAASLGK